MRRSLLWEEYAQYGATSRSWYRTPEYPAGRLKFAARQAQVCLMIKRVCCFSCMDADRRRARPLQPCQHAKPKPGPFSGLPNLTTSYIWGKAPLPPKSSSVLLDFRHKRYPSPTLSFQPTTRYNRENYEAVYIIHSRCCKCDFKLNIFDADHVEYVILQLVADATSPRLPGGFLRTILNGFRVWKLWSVLETSFSTNHMTGICSCCRLPGLERTTDGVLDFPVYISSWAQCHRDPYYWAAHTALK
jgi:hypothetical protein